MKKFLYKKAFLNAFDNYKSDEKELIALADKQIREFHMTQSAPYGLRIKKLFSTEHEKTFEARVSSKIRMIFVESKEMIAFSFLGNHDQIRRYIKSFS